MTIMANDKPAPTWRNFAACSGVGAILCLLVIGGSTTLMHEDGIGATVRSTEVAATVGLALILGSALVGFSNRKRQVSVGTLGIFAIMNAVAIAAFLLVVSSFQAGSFDDAGASEMAALAVGAVFVVIAVVIGAGLASPRFGSHYLNVEDAGDLREQRPVLWRSAGAMAAWGVMLVLLAADQLSPPAALAAVAVLLAIVAWLTLAAWRRMDELMRRLSTEGGNMSYYLVALAGGGWAMFAHLGFAPAPAPLDWLTMLTALTLPASFIVAGRRGLLAQR